MLETATDTPALLPPPNPRSGRTLRRLVVALVVTMATVHALIHVMGAAAGFGWTTSAELGDVTASEAGLWLLAGAATAVAALMLARRWAGWWLVCAGAALLSQAAVLTSWGQASAGTVANVVLLVAAGYGLALEGPWSLRARYRREVSDALACTAAVPGVVSEQDLAHLPEPVARYVRRSGAVGRPHVHSFRVRGHGRIRSGPDAPWMAFVSEQVNTLGAEPRRMFLMDATRGGLPVDVLHVFHPGRATMHARALGLITVVKASGAQMDLAETVTILNDACVFAPAALVDLTLRWEPVDRHRARVAWTVGSHTATAELVFDDDGDLINFLSDDRARASSDGRSFTPQPWSTPVGGYRVLGERRVAGIGQGHWHAAAPEGEFSYFELALDDLTYGLARA